VTFPECEQNATIRSPIGAPEVVWHDIKRVNFWKLTKFYGHVDYDKTDPKISIVVIQVTKSNSSTTANVKESVPK